MKLDVRWGGVGWEGGGETLVELGGVDRSAPQSTADVDVEPSIISIVSNL